MRFARLAGLLTVAAATAAQYPDAAPTAAAGPPIVANERGDECELDLETLAAVSRQTVVAKAHDGKEHEYVGAPLAEVLRRGGVTLGESLRGPAMANYRLVEAADGYRVVFALQEIDPASTDRVILLADRRDGEPLDEKHGPFQLVVPGEKRQSRWVRGVKRLSVQRAQ